MGKKYLHKSDKIRTFASENKINHDMKQSKVPTPTREEVFRQKAATYTVCYSTTCPNRDHCLRSLLSPYVPQDKMVCTSISLSHPKTQQADCPMFRSDQPVRMAQGFIDLYYDIPGRLEVAIKQHLISTFGRKRYYQYRNGSRLIPPETEQYIRKTLLRYGWTAEPQFDAFVEEYQW